MSATTARTDEEAAPRASLAQRIQEQREDLFRVMGVVDCCRYGSRSMIEQKDDRPDLAAALDAAYDMLNRIASALHGIAEDHE